MDTSLNSLVIRPATRDDYEAVVSISENAHDGYDHLATKFNQLMENPHAYGFVAELNNTVVNLELDELNSIQYYTMWFSVIVVVYR